MESKDPEYLKLYRRELIHERRALIDLQNRIHTLPADIARIELVSRATRYGLSGYRNRYSKALPTPHTRTFAYVNEVNTSITNTLTTLDEEKSKLDRMLGNKDG